MKEEGKMDKNFYNENEADNYKQTTEHVRKWSVETTFLSMSLTTFLSMGLKFVKKQDHKSLQ